MKKNLLIIIGGIILFICMVLMCSPSNNFYAPKEVKLTEQEKQEIKEIAKRQFDTPENRVMFAKKAQNFMLDEGFDMEFTATGKEKRTLECKYVLAGNVLAHKLSKGPFLDTVRDYSFDKFILRDGFGNSWTWDFKKVDSK